MTANGSRGGRKGTKSQDSVGSLIDLGKDVINGFATDIDRAMEESTAIREAEAKFGSPGAAGIEVRREGLLQRENPEDRKRKDALKANRDRGKLTADHTKLIGEFAANGQQFVMDVAEHLTEDIANRPAAVQPIGETLTRASMKILTAAYAQSLQFLAERGFQTIDQATPPEQQQQ
jgi:hypothetical protein